MAVKNKDLLELVSGLMVQIQVANLIKADLWQ